MTDIALQVLGALGWSILSIIVSQGVSIGLMAWLGLPPKKLVKEIEVIQNSAVGATFFIVSITVALFVGMFTTSSNSPTVVPTIIGGAAWIAGAFVMGWAFSWASFIIAHRVMGRENDESALGYIKRELIREQNASLAFFLGGLSVVCFVSVLFQTW
jgi:ABC-type multidrug transport system fused ATPase/permease subunit